MLYKTLIVILLSVCTLQINAKSVLHGTAPNYKNSTLQVLGFTNYITNTTQVLASCTVDSTGNFELTINNTETILINIPLGIYNGLLYLDTSANYNLILPDYKPITKAEQLNPFFKPADVYLGINNIDSLNINLLIYEFDQAYSIILGVNYAQLVSWPQKNFVDSIINSIEEQFSDIEHSFFKQYRQYKYAWINYISIMRDTRFIIREYFQDKPLLLQNPAYMDLFNQIFNNYFSEYLLTKEGERLYSDIALAKSPKYIRQTLSNNLVVTTPNLQELVMLKGINDELYSYNFPEQSLLITLDSVALLSANNTHKQIAKDIREKALKAREGHPAPNFELHDQNGILRTNNQYLANYVYLNFFSAYSYTCLSDLGLLKVLYDKHKTSFRVISICIDDDFDKAIKLFNDNGYEWMLLSYKNQPGIITDYKIKAYPSYFLIDPKGKLVMSPAAGPAENFEWRFFTYTKNANRKTTE